MSKQRDDGEPVAELLCEARREALLERMDGMEKRVTSKIDSLKTALYVVGTILSIAFTTACILQLVLPGG